VEFNNWLGTPSFADWRIGQGLFVTHLTFWIIKTPPTNDFFLFMKK
jgi:hypothetical protein